MSRGGSWLKSWWFCSISSSFAVFGNCTAADRWVPIAWLSPFPLFSLFRSNSHFGFAVGRNKTWTSEHLETLAEETQRGRSVFNHSKEKKKVKTWSRRAFRKRLREIIGLRQSFCCLEGCMEEPKSPTAESFISPGPAPLTFLV